MKLSTTTPASLSFVLRLFITALVVILAFGVPIQLASVSRADQFTERIRALERDIANFDAQAAQLSSQADTFQREVNRFNNEKNTIQAQIDLNQAKFEQLQNDIQKNEKKITDSRDALGQILADLYIDDSVSTVELLASSGSINEYFSKQELRSSTRDQLTTTIEEIKKIKKELEKQRADVQKVLDDQKTQRDALAAKEAEQQALVNATRGDEASYRNLSSQSRAQKDQLQREQQAAIDRATGGGRAVAGDPNKGGYPAYLANSDYYNPLVDPWGMYSRQCVSYTAWKVYQKNGHMPYWGGVGNANQWPSNARNAGITVSTTPRAGSVGVIMAGQYGHVVWVEGVNGDGTVNVSQYNYLNAGGSGWGHYSEMYNINPNSYNYYIYF